MIKGASKHSNIRNAQEAIVLALLAEPFLKKGQILLHNLYKKSF